MNLRQVLLGSSFRLSLGAAATGSAGPRLTAWGRVAGTTFDGRDGIDGRDGTLSLDGDVLTGTVGVDGEWDRLLAGLAVAHSRGDGSYTMPVAGGDDSGNLEQTLTSIHPYLRYAVNDRLDVWGLFGYGWGELDLEMDDGMTIETDTNLVMGAFGGRGILLAAPESGGFQLATRTDAMLTRTTSDKVAEMESAEADAHRLRLVLEGSRGFTWAEGRRLTPTMEVGLRHDWGDAETGFGLELGGRVQYADPALGLTIDATVRGLLAHEDSDYQEWGASGTVRINPGAGPRSLPDPGARMGCDGKRRGRPVVAADHGGPGAEYSSRAGGPPERGGGLRLRAIRHRTPDPLCGHGALGWRGPQLSRGRAPAVERGLGHGPGVEPGRHETGTGGPTAGEPGPPPPSHLELLT